MSDLQAKMKAWRDKWGVTQEAASKMLNPPVSFVTWNRWENGGAISNKYLRLLESLIENPPPSRG